MSAGLPQQIDVRRFAELGRHLKGAISFVNCPRLKQAVKAGIDPISVDLTFDLQPDGRRIVKGNIHGQVSMDCQRCLELVTIELDCPVSIGLVRDEAEAELLPVELDPLIVEDELNLFELIEDELILALPIVPAHDQCDLPADGLSDGDLESKLPERENPFAVLASLKKDK